MDTRVAEAEESPRVQTFVVHGTPRPQGSGAMVTSASTGKSFKKYSAPSVAWRNIVIDALMTQRGEATVPVEVPVAVTLTFRFDRPRSHSKRRRASDGHIKENGTDIDKLTRAILDALTVAKVVDDDRQVSDLYACKRYCREGEVEGVTIMVVPVG